MRYSYWESDIHVVSIRQTDGIDNVRRMNRRDRNMRTQDKLCKIVKIRVCVSNIRSSGMTWNIIELIL